MSETDFRAHLAENPRMIGVLFALITMLSSAGTAAAANLISLSGP